MSGASCKSCAEEANEVLAYMGTLGPGFKGASAAQLGPGIWVPPEWSAGAAGGCSGSTGKKKPTARKEGCQKQGPGCSSQECNESADFAVAAINYRATLGDGLPRASMENILHAKMMGGFKPAAGRAGVFSTTAEMEGLSGPSIPSGVGRFTDRRIGEGSFGSTVDDPVASTFEGVPFGRAAAEALVDCLDGPVLDWGVVASVAPELAEHAFVTIGTDDAWSLYVFGQVGSAKLGVPTLCDRSHVTRVDARLTRSAFCSEDESAVFVDCRWVLDVYRARARDGVLTLAFTLYCRFVTYWPNVSWGLDEAVVLLFYDRVVALNHQGPPFGEPWEYHPGPAVENLSFGLMDVHGTPDVVGGQFLFVLPIMCERGADTPQAEASDADGFLGGASVGVSNVLRVITRRSQARTGAWIVSLLTNGLACDDPDLELPPDDDIPEHL